MIKIDTHAHIFKQGLPLHQKRRYTPYYDATVEDYLQQLDQNEISHGVLIQPSFLGVDNNFMLDGIQLAQGRLRGVAVIDDQINLQDLTTMADQGIVGIRFNLIGKEMPNLQSRAWQQICQHILDLDWHIEVHQIASKIQPVLASLMRSGAKIVIDHFGRPDPKLGIHDPDSINMLNSIQNYPNVWVKISGAYRNVEAMDWRIMALEAMPLLRQHVGLERLLWGSDWPHTQYEEKIEYAQTVSLFAACVPDLNEQQTLADNARALYKFT